MTATLLWEQFDHLLATPADMEQLNRAILTLAMHSRLVPQDPHDEPASELIKRISHEIAQTNKVYPAKKDKSHAEIVVDEQPFKLPNGWKWVRVGDLCRLENGDRSKKNYPNKSALVSEGVPFVNAGHLVDGGIDRKTITFITKARFDRLRSGKFKNGDILFCLRGSLGKSALVEGFGEGAIASSLVIVKIHPFLSPQYFLHYFNSPLSSQMIKKYDNGTAQPNLSAAALAKFLIPLPPLAEQKRIVTRVEQLFAQTRALAEKLARAQSDLDALNQSALFHLLSSDSPEEFNRQWDFIAAHFETLFTRPEHIAPLRQSILELAVRGKLTRREEGDESARMLLERIRKEKEASGKKAVFAPVKESEKPFPLPDGWEWVRLGELVKKMGAGSTPKGGKEVYTDEGTKFIRSQNVYNDGLRLDDIVYISDEINKRMSGTIVQAKDILLNITGASIARSALVPDDFDSGNVNQHVMIIRMIEPEIRTFIHICMISPYIYNMIMLVQVGMSREGLSIGKLEQFVLPLPPLSEQARIVAKVEQLLGLCEALESRLRAAQEERSRSVESVLAGVGS